MKIQRLEVANFRSVRTASLPDISNFNVLIGQNNSGKSNLLSCLSIFFRCIASKTVVIDAVDFGNELDFHKRDLGLAIEIRVIFSLSPAERDAVIGDVISEVPEMRRAVEGLDPSLLLSLTVTARHRNADGPLLYVEEAAFIPVDGSKRDASRVILQVSPEAAGELQTRKRAAERLRKRAIALQTVLDRLDADDWARFSRRGEREPPGPPLSYYLREFVGLTGDMLEEIRGLITKSTSYQEFQNNALSQLNELQTDADARESAPLTNKISTITGEVAEVPAYINRLLERVASVGVLHLRERRKDIGAEEAERLLRLKVSRGGPEVLRGIQEIVQSLLGVQVDAFSAEPAERDADRIDRRRPPSRPRAELDVDDFLVEANGAGIREALRIILDYEFEHPDLVLIEEPEIHLHPALETSMLRYLKTLSKACQVFVATHSTSFLDTADLGNVYLTTKADGATVARFLGNEDVQEEIPKELGLRLSSLFMFDRLIFVEGPTDENILREVAAHLGANFASVNAGFIVMGGARSIPHFASEATITFLTRRQVKCWFILDRDERDDNELVELQAKLGGNAELCALGKREIENYLIVPRALAEYVGRRSRAANARPGQKEPVTKEQIQKNLDECAVELKELAVYKRLVKKLCKPNFSQLMSRHDQPQGANVATVEEDLDARIESLTRARREAPTLDEKVREEVNGLWEDRRLDIVPGEELLKKLFSRYGLSYKKERDGVGLASSLVAGEVHGDLKRIIERTCGV